MKTFIVDSFSGQPFKGNPAGVCLIESDLADEVMQNIANELGFSETAFVSIGDGDTTWGIRYFSPKEEIPLCGHATLAAAKALFETNSDLDHVTFKTGGGESLLVRLVDGRLAMEFPAYGLEPAEIPAGMAAALGLGSVVESFYNSETNILMLIAESESVVRALDPDFQKLVLTHDTIAGVLVTAGIAGGEFDFCSRFFWPWSGINEDPVTGATHTFMGPYWSGKLGKTILRSLQCSQRTGELDIEILDRGDSKNVLITGDAVLMLEGVWRGGM
jgi:PhzF family phenazine biosynthesis protein